MSLETVVESVRDGLASGMAVASAAGHLIVAQQILTSMRHSEPSTDIAELALRYRDDSVCGFDIAGAEDGFPPSRFAEAFDFLKRNNMFFTIHAGEAHGLPSIWEAVQVCGADRLGHGVRIVEDIEICRTAPRSSGGWPPTCATPASRWRSRPRRTCRRGSPRRWRSTRWGCCATCSST